VTVQSSSNSVKIAASPGQERHRLKILRICQETPYPPTDGVRIEPYFITKFMALRGHEITLLCFQSDARDVTPMREWCDLHTVPFDGRNTPFNLVRGVIERFPVNYIKYRDQRLLAAVFRLLGTGNFDVAVVDYSALGWFALQIKNRFPLTPVVTRWLNLDTLIWERWSGLEGHGLKRTLGKIQTGFVREFETQLAYASDLCLTIGAKDTELLHQMAPSANVEFLPAGIDVEHYAFQPASAARALLFLASSYKWHANSDAVKWLHDEIMPRIWARHPETLLYITGADHTPEMQRWTGDGRVVLTGFVPDEREVAAKCRVLVVPMRLGAGIKLKILTSFAMGKPVVTTSQGAEGVAGLGDGKHCLVRDSAEDFADGVAELLDNDELHRRLAASGRELVSRTYDWRTLAGQWEQLLLSVVQRKHGQVEEAAASMV